MSGSGGSVPRRRVERVDERLGLALMRVSLSPRTLVTYARDHVTVRTPSRPDFRDGNTIDLLAPPEPEAVDRWVARFGETVGMLGADRVQLRWEQPTGPSTQRGDTADPDDPAADVADQLQAPLRAACEAHGLELTPVRMLLLEELATPPATDAELVAIAAPRIDPDPDDPADATDRRWHASSVLYRYASGDTPDDYRAQDAAFTAWSVDVQRELAAAGRCQVWVAMRHGGPVARLSLLHDRQGLAVVEDVVVHPVHRGRGIAAALTHAAVTGHLAADPGARVGLGAAPGSRAERIYRRLGFRPHATVWTARQR